MDAGILSYVQLLFSKTWELFSINFPGFSFSIGSALLGTLVIALAFKAFGYITGADFSGGLRSAIRGGNNAKIKISQSRKGDTK